MRIIFGGAFNPPTIAHKDIYYFIQSKLDFSWFVYLPVSCLYHKEGLASNEDRYQMLKLLTKEMPKAKVSKDEYKDDKYLGTYHYLISQKEESRFLIGSDNLRDLKTWINYEKLVEDCRFIVISRGNMDDIGYIESDPLLSRFRSIFFSLEVLMKMFHPRVLEKLTMKVLLQKKC